MIKIIYLLLAITQVYCQRDVVGKLSVGYQAWFACKGDNSSRKIWIHWNGGNPPSKGHLGFENWPDVREYTNTYQTGFANLGNGQPAKLFGSYDDQTVETHLKWMQQNGIDVAAIQRFGCHLKNPIEALFMNSIVEKVINHAEKVNRKFYIMWDVSGWTNFTTELLADFTNTIIPKFSKSSAYAHQNGKPVVCIWGFGFDNRPGTPAESIDVIKFLKSKGAYVIGGVPKYWRTGGGSKKNYTQVYNTFDMISPWTVGGYNGVAGAKNYQTTLKEDHDYCTAHKQDYQPVIFPGFGWSNWHNGSLPNQIPRLHGDFLWQQFVNLRELSLPSVYVAMFDEYDEGTAIAKTAESKQWAPTDQYFYTLDADGVKLSSDFYLRVANDGAKMMKHLTPLQQKCPTKFVI